MSEEGTTDNENVAENEVVADSTTTAATSSSPTSPTPNDDVESKESAPENQKNSNESENKQNAEDASSESGQQELVQEQQHHTSDDAFDSIKDADATTATATDTTDNGATIDEPMEVDEDANEDAENSQDVDTTIANNDDDDTQTQKDAEEQQQQQQDEENEEDPPEQQPESHDQANESSELDGSHTKETDTHHDDNIETETSQMEVDCETPQGEDVPDRGVTAAEKPPLDDLNIDGSNAEGSELKSGDDESQPATATTMANESTTSSTVLDESKNADDSVMEHNVEQFNCSNMSDTSQKDQIISNDDPFDSLLRSDENSTSEQQQKNYDENDRSNAASSIGEAIEGDLDQNDDDDADDDGGGRDDGGAGSDHDDDNDNDDIADDDDAGDTNSHQDGSTIEGTDSQGTISDFQKINIFL